ncbi:MAG TPA: TrkA family potassium uptake protein [bacterium]|nr:TrkA family potassium uptake protein [bacterium]HPN44203.1 TrkA family potassium uptake protein [bacterium]
MLYIIVIGCGRLGSYLANSLSRTGHSIVIIDKNQNTSRLLNSEFSGFFIEGDATEFSVLKQARIDKSDVVVATTQDDNLNLMVAQIAKQIYQVKRVVARVFDPNREIIYRDFGIETICPTIISGEVFLDAISVPPAAMGGK